MSSIDSRDSPPAFEEVTRAQHESQMAKKGKQPRQDNPHEARLGRAISRQTNIVNDQSAPSRPIDPEKGKGEWTAAKEKARGIHRGF